METIKEEKKADLEQLLNSLIKKGWNVFGHKDRINAEKCNYIEGNYYNFDNHNISISLRELVAKESGLWQFVCENGMVEDQKRNGWQPHWDKSTYDDDIRFDTSKYQYRIIQSALIDEDKLEEFLLSNIDVEGKTD